MNVSTQDILYLKNRIAYIRDEQAYKKLFLHFYPSLFRFALHMVHHKESAEEIVSDVMMKVWEMDNKLAQVDNLKVYLLTAIKNASLTKLTKKELPIVPLECSVHETFDNETPEKTMLLSEVQQQINDAIKNLPSQCQMVFRLVKEESMPYKEVCSVLGISQNTAETHMRLALKKIRISLKGYLEKQS